MKCMVSICLAAVCATTLACSDNNSTPTSPSPPPPVLQACVPTQTSPVAGAILDNGCTDHSDTIRWDFDWTDCTGAQNYHLWVNGRTAQNPVIDDDTLTESAFRETSNGWIAESNGRGWRWRVRAKQNGVWGEWTPERTFDVETVNTDCS